MKKIEIGTFEKTGIFLFMIMMIANICSYSFQIIMGKMLSVEAYGTLNALIALISLINAPGSVVSTVATKYLAEEKKKNDAQNISDIWNAIFSLTILLQFITLIVVIILLPFFKSYLCISEGYIIILTGITAIIGLFPITATGALQGIQEYKGYGMQSVVLYSTQLLVSVILVSIKWNIVGVLIAISFANILSGIYSCIHLHFQKKDYRINVNNVMKYLQRWKKYIFKSIFARIVILLLLNMDMLIMKANYSEYVTGLYSSAMVISKIGMYLATSLIVPLFPMTIEVQEKPKKAIELFMKAFIYGVGSCVVYGVGLNMFGTKIVSILFGERYLESFTLLRYTCPYVAVVTGFIIVMNFVIASGNTTFFSISLFSAIVISLLFINQISGSAIETLSLLIYTIGITLILNLLSIFFNYKKKGIA